MKFPVFDFYYYNPSYYFPLIKLTFIFNLNLCEDLIYIKFNRGFNEEKGKSNLMTRLMK